MLATSKHALLREQQRAISQFMVLIIEEYAIEWQRSSEKLVQLLSKRDATFEELDVNSLIRVLKGSIKDLKRIEKKVSARNANMQVLCLGGVLATEAHSSRIKRWGC